MDKQQATVTLSKEEFLRYYEMDKALHGIDIKSQIIYFRESINYYDGPQVIRILNPDDAAVAMVQKNSELLNKLNQLEADIRKSSEKTVYDFDDRSALEKYNRIKNKWWFKLFYV